MALGSSLLATLLLAFTVAANPVLVRDGKVSLPLARRTNSTGLLNVLQRDQARATSLKARAQAKLQGRSSGSIEATNQAEDYVVSVRSWLLPPPSCVVRRHLTSV